MAKRSTPTTLKDLKPASYNPRKISAEAIEGLKISLTEFGDISGLVWNQQTGNLVAGHQRLEALKQKHGAKLKMTGGNIIAPDGEAFPVRVVDWPVSKEKAANVAANNPHIAGEFTEGLASLLDEIKIDLPDLCEALRLDELEHEKGKRITEKLLQKPIERIWILLGIPADKYAEVSELYDAAADIENAVVESTIRDDENIEKTRQQIARD
jgi:hypothetical protein